MKNLKNDSRKNSILRAISSHQRTIDSRTVLGHGIERSQAHVKLQESLILRCQSTAAILLMSHVFENRYTQKTGFFHQYLNVTSDEVFGSFKKLQ